jgi:hypothetical protein
MEAFDSWMLELHAMIIEHGGLRIMCMRDYPDVCRSLYERECEPDEAYGELMGRGLNG